MPHETQRSGTPRTFFVDERLVAPESRYEVEDGRVVYVSPSDEPHAIRHSKLSAMLEAHVADDYDVASDMLTRTSEQDDFAPDASIFPRERFEDRRQLEELAFEVLSTERLVAAGSKARKLAARGVRRIFAIDIAHQRAFEWSPAADGWQILVTGSTIADPTLAVALPVDALVSAAKADDAMAHALLAKKNPVLDRALQESEARGEKRGEARGEKRGEARGEKRGEARGEKRGEARGEKRGEARGMLSGRRAMLLDLLQAKFGVLPESVQERVRSADASALSRWAERLLHAESLEVVFCETPSSSA